MFDAHNLKESKKNVTERDASTIDKYMEHLTKDTYFESEARKKSSQEMVDKYKDFTVCPKCEKLMSGDGDSATCTHCGYHGESENIVDYLEKGGYR